MRVNDAEQFADCLTGMLRAQHPDGAAIEIGAGYMRLRNVDGEITEEYAWPTATDLAAKEDEGDRETYAGEKFCVECGIKVPLGAVYCTMDAPYGFLHWAAYFSPVGRLYWSTERVWSRFFRRW